MKGPGLVAALLLVAACHSRAGDPGDGAGALDVVVLSDATEEVGPIRFPHRLHYAPAEEGGEAISCGLCHHDRARDPSVLPGDCRGCHMSHDAEGRDPSVAPL